MLGSVRGFRLPRTPLAILVGLSLVPSFANRSVAETVVQATASDDKAPAQAASDTARKPGETSESATSPGFFAQPGDELAAPICTATSHDCG